MVLASMERRNRIRNPRYTAYFSTMLKSSVFAFFEGRKNNDLPSYLIGIGINCSVIRKVDRFEDTPWHYRTSWATLSADVVSDFSLECDIFAN